VVRRPALPAAEEEILINSAFFVSSYVDPFMHHKGESEPKSRKRRLRAPYIAIKSFSE
jgi:hypothetical protein